MDDENAQKGDKKSTLINFLAQTKANNSKTRCYAQSISGEMASIACPPA